MSSHSDLPAGTPAESVPATESEPADGPGALPRSEATVDVLVVDDHPVVRDGVASQLGVSSRLRVVGFAESGSSALSAVARLAPDVILLDLRLGDMLASELVVDLLRVSPTSRILLFTAYPEHAAVAAAVAAGAHGVLVKDVARGNLVGAVLAVAAGEGVGSQSGGTDAPGALGVLTAREYDVLRRAAMGQSNPEIADALFVSRNTVKSYMQNVLQKLGARNRVEAIARARDLGLL